MLCLTKVTVVPPTCDHHLFLFIMYCPICSQKFTLPQNFIEHLVTKEMFTRQQICDRMVVIGLLTTHEIDTYYNEDVV